MSTEEIGPRQRAAATKRIRTINAITTTARTLFDELGWYAVRLDDVAEEARVSSATLLNHFPTKRAVAIAAYEPQVIVFMSAAETALTTKAEAEPLLVKFIQELTEYLAAHPAMAIALLPLSREPRGRCVEDELVHHLVNLVGLVELLGKLLERHNNSYQPNGSARDLAEYHLLGLLNWIVQHPERSGKDAADLMLRHLL